MPAPSSSAADAPPRGALPPVAPREILGVAVLCCLFLALALPIVAWNSGAYDEGPHIASGVSYLSTGVFSGGIGNPPLAQLAVALPVKLRGIAYMPFDEAALPWARLPVVLATLATGLLIWRGGRRHGGVLAGLAGAALWFCEPTVLAHGTLATVDMIATTGVVFTTYSLWRVASKPTPQAIALGGVVLGLTLLTKYSVWMLVPVWALCVVWPFGRDAGPRDGERGRHVLQRAWVFAAVGVLAYLVLCSGFLWRRMGAPAPEGSGALLAALAHVLPEACTRGLAEVGAHARGGHMAYLFGQHSPSGFATYFLVAMGVKWTLPFLALLVTGVALFLGKRRVPAPAECALILPPLVWVLVASTVSRVDIGIRHLLPILPLLCEAAGVTVGALWRRSRVLGYAAVGCVVLHAASSLLSWPHEIGYFNLLAGGAARGDRVLLDSNIDWGTDRRWVEATVRADSTLRFLPPRGVPLARGRYLVNANAARGLFAESGSDYPQLADATTTRLVTPAWRIVEVGGATAASSGADLAARAQTAAATGRTDDAIALYTELAATPDPATRARALVQLAALRVQQGSLATADSLLATAGVQPGPDLPPWGPLRAEIASVREAQASDIAQAHLEVADWFTQHGAFDAAFDEATRAWHLDPASDDALGMLGNLAINEKAGDIVVQRLPADRGFWLSAMRRRATR